MAANPLTAEEYDKLPKHHQANCLIGEPVVKFVVRLGGVKDFMCMSASNAIKYIKDNDLVFGGLSVLTLIPTFTPSNNKLAYDLMVKQNIEELEHPVDQSKVEEIPLFLKTIVDNMVKEIEKKKENVLKEELTKSILQVRFET